MALEIWLPEGIHEETDITVKGKVQRLYAWPYKWFQLDVKNEGPDDVTVTIYTDTPQSSIKAITIAKGRGRLFDAKHPKYRIIELNNQPGQTSAVKIVASR